MEPDRLLITTQELMAVRGQPDVVVIDVRYSLDGRDEGYDLFAAGHIPGAVYLHWLDDWSDPDDPVEGQLAGPERFAEAMRRAGVDDASSRGALGLALIGVVNIPSASAAAASSASSAEGRGSARSDVGVELKGVRWSRKASMAGIDSEG